MLSHPRTHSFQVLKVRRRVRKLLRGRATTAEEATNTGAASMVPRSDFDCATWLHKAERCQKKNCARRMKELTGHEPHEIIYFKLYKS